MKTPPTQPQDRLIVALDVPSAQAALAMVDRLQDRCRWFKVGMELFFAAGPFLVEELRRRDLNVFLDLKLHDIPNTVASAIRSLHALDVQLLTVHGGGGGEMLAAAQAAASGPTLLAVTVLTSMDPVQLGQIGVADSPEQQVLRLARLAGAAGIPGLVCSPLEIAAVRAALPERPLLVVPGVRPLSAAVDDQRRTATPSAAIASGADMLVVGRPILRAPDPADAAARILDEIAGAL